ncbi:MAG: ATP-binding protein, partial [Myxococcota bacterium]
VRNAFAAGAKEVRVSASRAPGSLTIAVTDDGRGFDPAIVASAFEPFARGPGDGSGLGLALVLAVAHAHGGSTRIVRPGPGGTVIEVSLADP